MLEGNISLQPGAPKPDANPTILLDFKVTMWSASGIKVESLTVRNLQIFPRILSDLTLQLHNNYSY